MVVEFYFSSTSLSCFSIDAASTFGFFHKEVAAKYRSPQIPKKRSAAVERVAASTSGFPDVESVLTVLSVSLNGLGSLGWDTLVLFSVELSTDWLVCVLFSVELSTDWLVCVLFSILFLMRGISRNHYNFSCEA